MTYSGNHYTPNGPEAVRASSLAMLAWVALCAIAFATASLTTFSAYRYGLATSVSTELPTLQGAAYALLDVAKYVAIAIAVPLWRRARAMLAAGTVMVAVALSIASIWCVMSVEAIQRASVESGAAISEARAQSLKRDLARVETALASVDKARPSAVLMAEFEALKRDRRWDTSLGCTSATAPASKEFCVGHDRLFAELAAATHAEKLRAEIESIRREQRSQANPAPVNPELRLIAQWLGMDAERLGLHRALAWAIIIEVAGLLLVAAIEPMRPRSADVGSGGINSANKPSGLDAAGLPPDHKILPLGMPNAFQIGRPVAGEPSASKPRKHRRSEGPPESQEDPGVSATERPVERLPAKRMSMEFEQSCEVVREVFALLIPDPSGRVSGADLERIYRTHQARRSWRDIERSKFGACANVVVQELGGSRVRSDGMKYTGFRLPDTLTPKLVATSQVETKSMGLLSGE